MVKKFIPGGSKAGAGDVPGAPDELELTELADIDWGMVKEEAKGLGVKLLKDMEKDLGDAEENMKARMKIWKQALAMCEVDKSSFKDELMATQKTIQNMANPVKFSASLDDFTLAKDLNKYSATKMEFGTATEDEIASNKSNLTQYTEDVASANK